MSRRKLPFWHCRGMDGKPIWLSAGHKFVALERFERICRANSLIGRRMRFCHRCEAPMGTIRRLRYIHRFRRNGEHCPACGHRAYEIPDRAITTEQAVSEALSEMRLAQC